VGSRKARPVLVSAFMVAGLVLTTLLLFRWTIRSTNAGFEKGYARQDEYFTPRMKAADQQLQALSKRLGAEYVRGIVEWRSFATPADLATTELLTPSSVWRGGSQVRQWLDEYPTLSQLAFVIRLRRAVIPSQERPRLRPARAIRWCCHRAGGSALQPCKRDPVRERRSRPR
jgi:hypothetical protein